MTGGGAPLRTISSDPPACLTIRAMLANALVPRVRAITPFLETTVTRLLDEMERRGPVVDFVETFAHPLPIAVIAELLDVPEADRATFREQSRVIARGMDRFYGDDDVRRGLQEIGSYFLGLLDGRRAAAGDDLVTRLLAATHRDERMSDLEVVSMCTALVFGGHETTVNLLATGTCELLRRPEAIDRLRADPAATPLAVEGAAAIRDAPADDLARRHRGRHLAGAVDAGR